jgi:hypothetical protein
MQIETQNQFLESIASVLIRCFIMAVIVQLVWFGVFVGIGDLAFGIHEELFGTERLYFDMVNYFGLMFVKMISILFFLIPWLSIKLVVRMKKS